MGTRLTALEILARLVAFPTVSRESNLALVDWVEDYLAGHGIAARRVWNEGRSKAALYAQAGPAVPGGVVLSGHSDVVPVDGQPWTTDPWQLVERDGRLYGRGTTDMKGFDALAIWALVEAAEGGRLRRPLQLALSYDEELGCTGAPPMIAALRGDLPAAAAVIVGEPSMMRPVTAHKGGYAFHVHVRGHEVHSSRLPYGVSAVMEAARLVGWANAINAANAAAVPPPSAAGFDPPWTTLHVGRIEGGTAQNITARDCRMTFEIRVVPGEDPAEWEARLRAAAAGISAGMRRVHTDVGIAIDTFFRVPPLRPEADGAAEALVRRLGGDNGRHVVSYGTEAGQFQEAGYSAVVCGPGDIAQAHQPDEYLARSQFEAGQAFLRRLIDDLAR
ncbi:MAG: acetylornithine deacetylase [Rhodobacteraceae bacterium]|jgi:acetylornithine deacetylase|nr:acetylornithine deacetylase [Paracoccaceae bacterium]